MRVNWKRWLIVAAVLVVGVSALAVWDAPAAARFKDWVIIKGPLTVGTLTKTTATVQGGGSASSPVSSAVADTNFLQYFTKTTATSGTSRGIYFKQFFDDTTPSGETARFYSQVETAGATDVHGAHISIGYGTNGTCTGESAALRTTFMVPSKVLGGTNSSIYAELWADGTASDMSNGQFTRYVLSGNATGVSNLEKSVAVFGLEGVTIGSGNIVTTSTGTASTHKIRIKVNGGYMYLLVTNVP
jgi:hypothetical protein